ncbi:mechanosensitive ion channel domain-containing protein [Pseudomonas sp. F1_0610]|uniref:mechanosensitive ion channel family protein n=1 Tax=Pseudomonas sp. F1_0610 TaxID=3114284 RepID=UPI0039C4B32A
MNQIDSLVEQASNEWLPIIMSYGTQLVYALIVLAIGWWVVNKVTAAITSVLSKKNNDVTLIGFISSLLTVLLRVLLIISVAGMVGVQTTSFIAIIGAAGLAIGMALQGSLGNFAGGVLILFLRPFSKGDWIEAQGQAGTVESIQIFHTVLRTGDNKKIILPNGALSNGAIVNVSAMPTRQIYLNIGIDYAADVKQARQIMLELASQEPRILTDTAPVVHLANLGESSVDLSFRFWVNNADYWAVFFAMQEKVKEAFDQAGIEIPFPQRTVHMKSV